jgi:hypothetical protein
MISRAAVAWPSGDGEARKKRRQEDRVKQESSRVKELNERVI